MVKHGTKKSKRQTLHKKHKIESKIREHHRKQRREAKKNPHKRLKKDPGVPNLHPFKEKLLKQMQETGEMLEAERRRREQALKGVSQSAQAAKLQLQAERREAEFQSRETLGENLRKATSKGDAMSATSRRNYIRELKKVTELADVIIEVLDARDPLGCRCPDLENMILAKDSSKKIILLLNKIDMVPREVVVGWIKFLSQDYPTVAFKASTQTQKHNLGQVRSLGAKKGDAAASSSSAGPETMETEQNSHPMVPVDVKDTNQCLGADILMSVLKSMSVGEGGHRKSMTVGVIGFPNVGKSSVINSLKRARVAGVGNRPGFTKTNQEVYLDSHTRLIDSPGIIFSSGDMDSDIILRNCVRVETIEDPVQPVEIILRRCNWARLMDLYGVSKFRDAEEFLGLVAASRGKFKHGGVPNIKAGGQIVLQDWNRGKIPFFTLPPEFSSDSSTKANFNKSVNVQQEGMEVEGGKKSTSAAFRSSLAPAFDIDALTSGVVSSLPTLKSLRGNFVTLESGRNNFSISEFESAQSEGSTLPSAGSKRRAEDVSDMEEEAYEGTTDEEEGVGGTANGFPGVQHSSVMEEDEDEF